MGILRLVRVYMKVGALRLLIEAQKMTQRL